MFRTRTSKRTGFRAHWISVVVPAGPRHLAIITDGRDRTTPARAASRSVHTSNVLSRCLRDIHTATQHIIIFKPNYKAIGQYYFGKAEKKG